MIGIFFASAFGAAVGYTLAWNKQRSKYEKKIVEILTTLQKGMGE